mgnify:CR=1 FL=1
MNWIKSVLITIVLSSSCQAQSLSVAFAHENYDFFQLLELFELQTGIHVTPAAITTSRLKVELLQKASANQLPDAVIVPGDYIGLDEINFSRIPDEWFSPDTDRKHIQAVALDGHNYGVPVIAGNHLVLFYNKSLVTTPARNWLQLSQQSFPQGVATISWSYNEMYWFLPFLAAFEQLPLVDHSITLNTEGMRDAMVFYQQVAQNRLVDKNCNYQCSVDKFLGQNVAYTINGAWAWGRFKKEMGEQVGIALLPNIGDRRMQPYFSVHALAFPNQAIDSEKRDSLQQLAQFFQSYEVQMRVWQRLSSLPVSRAVMADVLSNADDNTKALIAQLQQAHPMPTSKEMAIVWEAMLKGMNRYQAGVFDLNKATSYMQYIAIKSVNERD